LLDGNMLIAISLSGHVHHQPAATWLGNHPGSYVTTPITQGTLLRTVIRLGATATEALEVLESLTQTGRHVFWPDTEPFTRSVLTDVTGHADVTDAYLAALARTHGARLVTLDSRLGERHQDVVEVIPTR
jgi:toxin-antitoxin system PIN domain toxin